jgi:hypothetical protein
MNELWKSIWFFVIMLIATIFVVVITLNALALSMGNDYFCDYDSCSQEAMYGNWQYNGSACFDFNNSDCQDFLRLWDVCQNYKQRLGAC